MSDLISQPTVRFVADLLDDLVLRGIKPSDAILRQFGTDIAVLEQIFESYKPSLNWFAGYDTPSAWLYKAYAGANNRQWLEYRQGLPKSGPRMVRLLYLGVQGGGSELRSDPRGGGASVQLFLNKRGQWVVWSSIPKYYFRVFQNVEPAIKYVEAHLPDVPTAKFMHRFQMDFGAYHSEPENSLVEVPSVALAAARSLQQVFEESTTAKQGRLDAERETQQKGASILNATDEPKDPRL